MSGSTDDDQAAFEGVLRQIDDTVLFIECYDRRVQFGHCGPSGHGNDVQKLRSKEPHSQKRERQQESKRRDVVGQVK